MVLDTFSVLYAISIDMIFEFWRAISVKRSGRLVLALEPAIVLPLNTYHMERETL